MATIHSWTLLLQYQMLPFTTADICAVTISSDRREVLRICRYRDIKDTHVHTLKTS